MATLTLENWVSKNKAAIEEKVISWGYERDTDDFNEEVKVQQEQIDALVAKVSELIESKSIESQRKLFPYFENLSHNRNIAFLFSHFTGIDVGTTNKRGIEAFVEFFGDAVPLEVEAEKQRLEEEKKEAAKKEKADKENEKLEYFSDKIWNKGVVAKLTPLQYGKAKKVLDKEWNFSGNIMTMRNYLISKDLTHKEMTNNMHKWNRRKSNNMYADEQREYEAKLIKGRTYHACYEDYVIVIAKTIFDLLALEDKTNIDGLAS